MHRLLSGLALLLTLTVVPASATATAPAPGAEGSRTAAAVDRADRADRSGGLVVRNRAWGPLRLRMTGEQAQATGMVSDEWGHCAPGYEMEPRFAERGFVNWRVPGGDEDGVRVGSIVILTGTDRTENGAGVGTTLRRLRQLYPRLTRLMSYAELEDQRPSRRMTWTAGVRKHGAYLNFQFDYGRKPGPRSTVEYVVVSPRQLVWMGC